MNWFLSITYSNKSQYKVYVFTLSILFLIGFTGCTNQTEKIPNEVITETDEDAEASSKRILEEVAPTVTEGMEVSLWASEKMVRDPIALDVDPFGRILVTTTERRKNGELDIRAHPNWMIESLTFESTQDRQNFIESELAIDKSDQNSWLADNNNDGSRDWRDLTVNRESVYRLEDISGNGFANQSKLFIRDFNENITDVAGGVHYHQKDVFLGVSPDLWRIRDLDEDGYGEVKESISHGFGTNIGFSGHGMSGVTVGPDGRIYWSIGDVGMSVTDKDGKNWHFPRQGVIARSEPDGSNFEVFSSGLRNTHEFVFDAYGNLIAVDNDGDHAGETERLVYAINGSDSGWRLNWQFGKYDDPRNNDYSVLMDEEYYKPRFDDQAAHLLPALAEFPSGHAGMAYNPGTALNEQWKDHFFIAEFVGSPTGSGIHAFTINEKGASFELTETKQVLKGILATGLSFGPDGSLYFADWIEGWELKQKGRIWKLDVTEESDTIRRMETKDLLAEDFSDRSLPDLQELLRHDDMRVRQKAQFEFAEKEASDELLKAIDQTEHQLARIHGIWGLAQIGRRNNRAVEPLVDLLDDSDSEIRAQAAKMLGDVRYETAAEDLIQRLNDDNARVRFFATEALGRLAWVPALEPLIEMLEENNDEDVYLRHAGAIALERIGDSEAVTELSNHPSKAVRIAAVVALKRMQDPGVARFLRDQDEFIVTNAARAINDDTMIEEAIGQLAVMLEQDQFMNEPLIRRAINANLYSGSTEAAQRLALFAANNDMNETMRIEALHTLSVWPKPSILDRVTGDPRGEVENNPIYATQALETVIDNLLQTGSPEIKIASLEAIQGLQFSEATPVILGLVDNDSSPEVRIAALRTLIELDAEDIEQAIYDALDDDSEMVRINALREIPELNLSDQDIVDLLGPVLEKGRIEERQSALASLGRMDSPGAYKLLEEQMRGLMNGYAVPQIELEIIEAVESAEVEFLTELMQDYETEKSREDSISVFRESLYGGDAEEGRRIFYRDAGAQCIRCHVVAGEGSEVGPNLTEVANRFDREGLLREMVDPNARIAPGYGTVALTMNNGETIRGVVIKETDTQLTLTNVDGEQTIEKREISEQTSSPSGMPAMGQILTKRELRDLVEFLSTLSSGNE